MYCILQYTYYVRLVERTNTAEKTFSKFNLYSFNHVVSYFKFNFGVYFDIEKNV